MFSENFIVAVKVGGQVLRESGNLVSLPFGCEYTILLKNLNSRRAMVSVGVDGNDATDGKLILAPNATLELERFIRNGNLNSGNRFKFIERTAAVEKHRGVKEDDGLIRAEFWAEREVIEKPIVRPHYYDEYFPRPIPWDPYEYPRPWPRRPIIRHEWWTADASAESSSESSESYRIVGTAGYGFGQHLRHHGSRKREPPKVCADQRILAGDPEQGYRSSTSRRGRRPSRHQTSYSQHQALLLHLRKEEQACGEVLCRVRYCSCFDLTD